MEMTRIATTVYFFHIAAKVIETTVTSSVSTIEDWIRKSQGITIEDWIRKSQGIIVFGLEVGWTQRTGTTTIQLLGGNKCLIIQFNQLTFIPSSLKAFCSDPTRYFVGTDITDNMKSLRRYGLVFSNKVEIRGMSEKDYLLTKECFAGSERLVTGALMDCYCGARNLINVHRVESEWDERVLDKVLVNDAVIVAHVYYKIGRNLISPLRRKFHGYKTRI